MRPAEEAKRSDKKTLRVAQKMDHTDYFISPTNHKELPISILLFY